MEQLGKIDVCSPQIREHEELISDSHSRYWKCWARLNVKIYSYIRIRLKLLDINQTKKCVRVSLEPFGKFEYKVIVEGCLRSYVRGLSRTGNGAQQLKNSVSRMLEANETVRNSLTQKDRTAGQRCATRDCQRTHEITKDSCKTLSSPGNIKAL